MSELLPVAWRVEWNDGIVHLFERKPESQAGKGNCISVTPLYTSPRVVDVELAARRVIAAFKAHGKTRGASETVKTHHECESVMVALKAALGEGK